MKDEIIRPTHQSSELCTDYEDAIHDLMSLLELYEKTGVKRMTVKNEPFVSVFDLARLADNLIQA